VELSTDAFSSVSSINSIVCLGFWSELAPKDWLSFSVGFSGLVIGLLSLRDRKRQPAIQEFLKILTDIENTSKILANRIEDSLIGCYQGRAALSYHHKNLQRDSNIRISLGKINNLLDKEEAERLFSQYTDFWGEISEHYPITKGGTILSSDSIEVKRISSALEEWLGYLAVLHTRCVRHKLKCW